MLRVTSLMAEDLSLFAVSEALTITTMTALAFKELQTSGSTT